MFCIHIIMIATETWETILCVCRNKQLTYVQVYPFLTIVVVLGQHHDLLSLSFRQFRVRDAIFHISGIMCFGKTAFLSRKNMCSEIVTTKI